MSIYTSKQNCPTVMATLTCPEMFSLVMSTDVARINTIDWWKVFSKN